MRFATSIRCSPLLSQCRNRALAAAPGDVSMKLQPHPRQRERRVHSSQEQPKERAVRTQLYLAKSPEKNEYSFSFDRSLNSSSGKRNPARVCTREGSVRDDIAMPVGSAKRASERPVSHSPRVLRRRGRGNRVVPDGDRPSWTAARRSPPSSIRRLSEPARKDRAGKGAFKIAVTVSRLPKTRSSYRRSGHSR